MRYDDLIGFGALAATCALIALGTISVDVNILGAWGSVISFVLWLPQARRTWMIRHDRAALAGISTSTHLLVCSNAITWFAFALYTRNFWVGAPGLINLPLSVATLIIV